MVPPREILKHLLAEPFRPLRIHMASGRTFEVRHPEMAQIPRSTMIVHAPAENDPDGPGRWEQISYVLIESLAPIDVSVGTGG